MATQPTPVEDEAGPNLATARIAYLILYVRDLSESRAFYERQLGLRVLEADEDSVKFDAGMVILCLNRASDFGVTLGGRQDDSSDLVFLVDDVNAARAALEARGVTFVRRRTYEIGLVTDFYDPNGHRLMIYQPSPKALSWPSGEKLREVWRASGLGGAGLIGPAAGPPPTGDAPGLDGKPLVYMFMFVPDSAAALAFYHGGLGLRPIEQVHCCNPACPPEEKGIAKYDVGGLLLTTHHVHRSPVVDDFGRVYSPRAVNPDHTGSIVPVLHVPDLRGVVECLSRRRIHFSGGIVRSHLGLVAKIESETGHKLLLYQPSDDALPWPCGVKLQQICDVGQANGVRGADEQASDQPRK
jgi:catechol 2,3-dioxygenase-like lactoylglutathione lyase family enzyme